MNAYRFGFNGMEKDDEMKGNGNSLDFGARIYDPRIGRWLALDPLAFKYPYASPYNFVLNTPISAIDPDGEVVVFVNGNHFGDGGKKEYWNGVDDRIMTQFKDYKSVYRDGAMGGWAPFNGNIRAQARRNAGFSQGRSDAKALIENLDVGETIKIVTHSMGGAYGKGYVQALKEYIADNDLDVVVEIEVDFAPFQPDDEANSANGARNPAEASKGSVPTFQASHSDDGVAGNKEMKGAEQLDTSEDEKQDHPISTFDKTVEKLGGVLDKVRTEKE
jgi:RHS repeat-associated protein